MKKGTVVLAFSGGLDTSVCIPLLRERYGYDRVITVAVDVGQPEADIRSATEKGRRFADAHYTIDAKEKFVEEYVFPSIQANGSYEGYPLGTALARPLIAEEAVAIAKSNEAKAVAHGCTGKGNDQLRFDFIIRSAGLEVVAPIRELNLTRTWEIEYARKHKIPVAVAKKNPYSVDENCWNRSIEGGRLEDPSFHPPESIYRWTVSPEKAPDTPEEVTVTFEAGIPVALDGERMKGIDLVQEMNLRAGRNGVGRNDMIEDRILGLKARGDLRAPCRNGPHHSPRGSGAPGPDQERARIQADGGRPLVRARLPGPRTRALICCPFRLYREDPGAGKRDRGPCPLPGISAGGRPFVSRCPLLRRYGLL